MSTIADRFKQIRLNKGIRSQATMADKLGVTRQAIANVESGHNNPSIETICKLIETFNINANWLLTGKGDVYIEASDELSPELEKALDKFLKKKGLL